MSDRRPIGFWLKLVDNLIDEQFALTLEEHGITRRQWQLLNVLAAGPASVTELDAQVAPFLQAATDDNPAESTVEHHTEHNESAWGAATPTGNQLTERGAAALSRLEVVVTEQRTRSTVGVSEQEYLTTVGVLERVARNLGYTG